MEITFLGTGAVEGCPKLGCNCKVCRDARKSKKLQRLRSSVLVKINGKKFIIDTTPDFRQQVLKFNINPKEVKAILITHLHPDHIWGIQELELAKRKNVKVVMGEDNIELFRSVSYFSFLEKAKVVKLVSSDEFKSKDITFFPVNHSKIFPTYAIGIKNVLYASDVLEIDKSILDDFEVIIFDGTFLRRKFPTHMPIVKSVKIFKELGKEVIYTHFSHSNDVRVLKKLFSKYKFVKFASDGLRIKF